MRAPRVALLLVAILSPIAARAAGRPVAIAVDTSRSLRAAELAAAEDLLEDALAEPGELGPLGLLAFDDVPRWVVPPGAGAPEVLAALSELRPAGDHTLLRDALFVAARDLPSGGAILLVTDGRDENSATTVEDVAAVARERGVTVVAVAIGRRVDDLTLRRLALLTDGRYLGPVGSVAAADLATALATAGPPSTPEPARPGPESVAPAVAATPPAVAETPQADRLNPAESSERSWLWWVVPIVVAAGAAVLLVVARRSTTATRSPRVAYCDVCGSEIAAGEGSPCPHCAEVALQRRLREREVARLDDTAAVRVDPDLLASGAGDRLEKTRVLLDQSMLTVREPGESPRTYVLPVEGGFSIGRDAGANTLALRDPTLSSRHFMVTADNGHYVVVDLDSTNGTFLDRRRVLASPLRSGDVIRAGQSEFEYRRYP